MKHLIDPSALALILTTEKNNSGGADFTIVSLRTGKDYTFNIARKNYNGKWYTYVNVERGYQNYLYLGFYSNGNIIFKGAVNYSESATAITWVLRQIESGAFDVVRRQAEIFHLGQCLKCGKTLTDAKSIEIGLGPICRTTTQSFDSYIIPCSNGLSRK